MLPGLNPGGIGTRWHRSASGWGLAPCRFCFACRVIVFAPIPDPFPAGRGTFVYFAGGYRPRHPCIRPFAALYRTFQTGSRRWRGKLTVQRITNKKAFPQSSAGSQGEGGPGERNWRLRWSSPGAGIASAAGKSALRARAGGWGRKNYDTAGKAGAAGHSAPAGQQRRQGAGAAFRPPSQRARLRCLRNRNTTTTGQRQCRNTGKGRIRTVGKEPAVTPVSRASRRYRSQEIGALPSSRTVSSTVSSGSSRDVKEEMSQRRICQSPAGRAEEAR